MNNSKVESRDLHRSSPLMNHNDAFDIDYFYSVHSVRTLYTSPDASNLLRPCTLSVCLSVGRSHMYGVQTWPCKSRDDMFHAW